jgi:hypothetical protein
MDGPRSAAEGGGDLGIGKIMDVAKCESDALLRRQLGKCRGQSGAHRELARQLKALRACRFVELGEERERRLAGPPGAPPLETAESPADGDPVNPSLKRLRVAKPVERAEHVDGNVLGDVAGLLAAADECSGGPQGQSAGGSRKPLSGV